jgi:hypothetical protein
MTTTARQNNLILNQDWTRIYQTFKNADFKSYDFENLRRVMITYLRENYPEDFNDYIESSEYLALIDAVAFLGQSLAFRIDLASRENFIELAERKDSVLRLARMLGYNPKRNKPAAGLLKFTSVSTTESIVDSNGKNLAQQIISWNDPTNSNWLEQFIIILNASMASNTEFGRSQGSATIQGILTEQYRFNSISTDVPIYSFSKTVAGRAMVFEVVSTSFKNAQAPYEEAPVPGNQLGYIYRNDGSGPGSANTGFYLMFKQGSLELADFAIDVPTTNEKIAVDSANINNDDVWLFKLSSGGVQLDQWTQVANLVGNNIAYNSVSQNIRNIYAVQTKESDKIDLIFADGVYGNLPQGTFRVYYRVSNGLSYIVAPNELRGITIAIPYVNKQGTRHTVSINLALQSSVSSAAPSEDIDTIRTNAPALYYTQNRMITGEDYNLAPLSSSQDIIKIKSINRTSSGISRNYEIIDASGKYSSVTVFADDGYIYKKESEKTQTFKFASRVDIINYIRQAYEVLINQDYVYNYYLTKFDKILFGDTNIRWESITTDINMSTGYFYNFVDSSKLRVGSYSTNSLKYMAKDTLIKFVPPTGYAFKNGALVTYNAADPYQTTRIWTKAVQVVGDGTANGVGTLPSGIGAITFSDVIPSGAVAVQIIPKFINDLPPALENELVNQIYQNLNFGVRYDIATTTWKIISASNVNFSNNFTLGKAGDTTDNNLDSSWLIAFVKEADQYLIRIRSIEYIFGSVEQNRFYFDSSEKQYNDRLGNVVKDQVKVLSINPTSDGTSSLNRDYSFEIVDTIKFEDGFESSTEIQVAFKDGDDDGVIDDPESFIEVAGQDIDLGYLFFKETADTYGNVSDVLVDTSVTKIRLFLKQTSVTDFVTWPDGTAITDGDLVYFYDSNEDRIMSIDTATNTFILQPSYKAYVGRQGLKFQYIHNASVNRRIDPSSSNIIDIFLLTRNYDTAFRTYIAGGSTEPSPPTTDQLRINYGSTLDSIKSISDEIIYHPVKYKILFGSKADQKLQATFKVVKNPSQSINDNDLKVRIISAVNTFFDINNWDFGDRFYLSELVTYVINSVTPDVSNMIIIPKQSSQAFGSLFEIQSRADEIFVSGATVDDVEIVKAVTAIEVRADVNSIVSST